MKSNFRILTILLLISTFAFFTSCKKDEEDDNNMNNSYTEITDSATGRAGYLVDDSGNGTGSVTWKKDHVYVLNGLVFVNDGQTLVIEEGTVIKGKPGQGEQASALIVARGGKIIADGTATEPIIFTAEADKLDGSLGTNQGLWGGLIILGKAKLNSSPGETSIEGIPTNEPRGLYGGNDDADNSGSLRYVSIRHGGTDIGAGNEINGLTLGGVGSGTTLEYIEIFANADDGVEFFGGAPRIKYLVSAFCGDDCVDYDEGYRGLCQFVFAYQHSSEGDRGGEHDGGTDPETGNPYATPIFMNVTYVGNGVDGHRLITFRDNAGGEYHNSIFCNFSKGVDIEYLASGESSFTRFSEGVLKLTNNTFVNVAGNEASKMILTGRGDGLDAATADQADAAFATYFTSNNNQVATSGISRSNVVPTQNNSQVATAPNSFFSAAPYRGAFQAGQEPWYKGWTIVTNHIQ